MDRTLHKRYLDYRERHVYFGRMLPLLGAADFTALEAEAADLAGKGADRDDEEEARYAEVLRVLLKD
jgi:hypothetical protein